MQKIYTIPRGKHYSVGFRPGLVIGRTRLKFRAWFGPSCIYVPQQNPGQVNKLYGMSFGLHQNHSARIGWRSDGKGIELFAYLYLGPRDRRIEPLLHVATEIWTTFEIFRRKKMILITVNESLERQYFLKAPSRWGYTLYPYFGGDLPAPHTMSIKIEVLEQNGFGF